MVWGRPLLGGHVSELNLADLRVGRASASGQRVYPGVFCVLGLKLKPGIRDGTCVPLYMSSDPVSASWSSASVSLHDTPVSHQELRYTWNPDLNCDLIIWHLLNTYLFLPRGTDTIFHILS